MRVSREVTFDLKGAHVSTCNRRSFRTYPATSIEGHNRYCCRHLCHSLVLACSLLLSAGTVYGLHTDGMSSVADAPPPFALPPRRPPPAFEVSVFGLVFLPRARGQSRSPATIASRVARLCCVPSLADVESLCLQLTL